MKYLILLSFIVVSCISFAQTAADSMVVTSLPIVESRIFQIVEQMPEFPGGEEAMMKFIQHNIIYPDLERENDIQGRVVVGFIVNEDGSLSDFSIKKSVSKGIDKESLRVVRLLPKFKPGKQQGKPVKVQYLLPIMFKLSTNISAPAIADTKPHPLPMPPAPKGTSKEEYEKEFSMPEFPGGDEALTAYINSHNKFLKAKSSGKDVYVVIMASIDSKGKIVNTSIQHRLPNDKFNAEATRIVSKLPKFKPAVKSGKPSMWYYIIPVMFIE